jgi:peptide/nickel transport system permease protein
MLSQNDISAGKLSRDQLIAALGLDKPMWEQYGRWAGAILLRGDFGTSLAEHAGRRAAGGAAAGDVELGCSR